MSVWPPFLPVDVWETVDYETRVNASRVWLRECNLLLETSTDMFWSRVLDDPAAVHFLRTFLRSYRFVVATSAESDTQSDDVNSADLLKGLAPLVLRLLQRLAEPTDTANKRCEPDTAMGCLVAAGLLDAPGLLDVVATFGRSNRRLVAELLAQVMELEPSMREQQAAMLGSVAHSLRMLAASHTSSKDKNEASVKSKSSTDSAPALQPVEAWPIMLDLATSLDAFVYVSCNRPLAISHLHMAASELLRAADMAYTATLRKSPTPDHVQLIRTLRRFKYATLSFVNGILEHCYLAPLSAFLSPSVTDDDTAKPSTAEQSTRATRVCDLLLQLLDSMESAESDESLHFMDTAPLLVDLEIEYNLSSRLSQLQHVFASCDEPRAEYLILSLEHFRTTVGKDVQSLHERFDEHRVQQSLLRQKNASAASADLDSAYVVQDGAIDFDDPDALLYTVRTSSIAQVRDVFPHLSEGFVEACLESYDDNVETVIARLLEDDLADDLRTMDRDAPRLPLRSKAARAREHKGKDSDDGVYNDEPGCRGEDLLATRRNIFDNDAFDVFARGTVDANSVYRGKKNSGNAETTLNDKTFVQQQKAAILDRAFADDGYDDEYDDTYDDLGDEVGAQDTVDTDEATTKTRATLEADTTDPAAPYEAELVRIMVTAPSVFERTSAARRSKERAQLRATTNLSDEQIEGWAVQMQRNPRKSQILEKHEWRGEQRKIVHTQQDAPRGRGRGRGRGPPRDNNGRPGSASGPEDARSRAIKDRHKASRGNHNRKRGHARKMRDTVPNNSA
ncbi:hypothetical protein THASP1DRAFT_29489 [Thamnocephalis sphaerospora]|uniref:CUE domain-containing protein n=1 Tax=Thamnocephalis sphaerospora TaxID=78915 RepID=A0A4P9XRJ1_9FUNG|nr:hypothetical protein THASP1DRAFT_29489 [Thamnocephalis sphaerospora]|eukprot:RKP08703.1 hypothetical protein THASP1DRAFT_29489 [Thamnocephalis sphaerospora]